MQTLLTFPFGDSVRLLLFFDGLNGDMEAIGSTSLSFIKSWKITIINEIIIGTKKHNRYLASLNCICDNFLVDRRIVELVKKLQYDRINIYKCDLLAVDTLISGSW